MHKTPLTTDGTTRGDPDVSKIASTDKLAELLDAACEVALTRLFIKRPDKARYEGYWANLKNQYANGYDDYPYTLPDAFTKVQLFRPAHGTAPVVADTRLMFATTGGPAGAKPGQQRNQFSPDGQPICNYCRSTTDFHLAKDCPKRRADRAAQGAAAATGASLLEHPS